MESADAPIRSSETASSMEVTTPGLVRRWMAELDMAARTEKEWCDESREIWKTYEASKTRANAFNILWSNTDTLAPAVFNSMPVPDVRRRFRDADPVGKLASQVIERTQAYELDQYDAEKIAKDAVLDMLLPGRGVIRIRYVPMIEGDKVLDEIVPWEHVQWDEFRRGPGKRWDDVRWVAFAHDMSRETAEKTFGPEITAKLTFAEGENASDLKEKEQRDLFQTTRVWEIWDKDQRRVLFIAPCYKDAPCKVVPDPLGLTGFYPMARPAYAVEQSRSLLPIPLYRLYKEQAKELDRVSTRINKIVNAMKVRGAYVSSQADLEKIIEADDNQMIPVENVSGMAEMGGLDKAIWIMPIDKLERVLVALYQARDQIKGTIYEITGISDIIRGQTSASESATAQKLKSEWGTMRLQKMQKEIQRLLRDTMRLQAEIYAEKYDQQRFAAITGMQLPTQQQKMQAQAMMKQIQQQAAMQPQPAMAQPAQGAPGVSPAGPGPQAAPAAPPIPPEMQQMLATPSWEEVMAVLKSDGLRQYRIDIETDSTVKDVIDRDMMGLAEVTEAIGQLIAGAAPAVQSGMLPVDVPKEVALAIARRARLGTAVEDALEKIQQPAPMQQVDPEQQKQMEAGKKDIETGKADLQKQQMAVADQHRGMLEQALKMMQQQAMDATKQAQMHQKRADDITSEMGERGPADKVFETLLQQLMESQQQTQMLVQQSMAALQATLQMATEQSQTTAQAVMQSMAATAAAVTAPRQVQVQLPSGKTATAVSSVTH